MFSHIKELFTRPSGYRISRSVRLRSSASAYFNRTPASAGSQTTWTYSAWVKIGALGTAGSGRALLRCYNGTSDSTWSELRLGVNNAGYYDSIALDGYATNWRITNAQFRDPSAWYHIVVVWDTTNATAANRVRIYVNGVQQTSFQTSNDPALNATGGINQAAAHVMGSGLVQFFDGYLTEINFIDGQALTPSSFGSTNAVTGVWQPIKYTGTYGTNGFYLNFSDNSNNTATTIGKDYSGNGNNWTPNNISVTAGTTYDSMLDVPTPYADGGNGRGNYAVLNPLDSSSASNTISGANLNATITSAASLRGSIYVSTGKWYYEVTVNTLQNLYLGLASNAGRPTNYTATSAFGVNNAGDFYEDNTLQTEDSIALAAGAVYGIAFDATAKRFWIAKDGQWYSCDRTPAITISASDIESGNFGYDFSTLTGDLFSPHFGNSTNAGAAVSVNFGQRPFSYTPPTGFKALNTQNLPTPTISNGATVMAASTYTGTGATQTIANSGNNAASISFKPDLVWIKSRSAATDHKLTDSVRGTTKALISDTTGAETTDTNGLTAFGTTGFTIGTDTNYNNNTATYVAWQWQAGQGSTSSNTSGSITSTVSVNATAGFSVVTYTGNATNGASYGHGLGVAPSMVITKARSGANDWATYHVSLGSNQYLFLNQTAAAATFSGWLTPSANVNTFTNTSAGVNTSGATYVAYCFAAVAGYSAFGKYTGNGSTDGPFLYFGFRPRWIMYKRTDTTGNWNILDTSRDPINLADTLLRANLSNADEVNTVYAQDFLSNGWKIRSTNVDINVSGATYIYAAFAESPFKLALAR